MMVKLVTVDEQTTSFGGLTQAWQPVAGLSLAHLSSCRSAADGTAPRPRHSLRLHSTTTAMASQRPKLHMTLPLALLVQAGR